MKKNYKTILSIALLVLGWFLVDVVFKAGIYFDNNHVDLNYKLARIIVKSLYIPFSIAELIKMLNTGDNK